MLDLLRELAETVNQFSGKSVDLMLVLDLGETSIEREADRQIGNVILRNEQRRADGDLRRPTIGNRRGNSRLQTHHCLFEHLLVQLEADFLDVAGLLLAEEVAGAADVEIVRCELEARTQGVKRLQHLEPSLGLGRDRFFCREGQQCIGAQLSAPYPAAKLIELCEAEPVGAMNDQRIRGRYVEAGFDNCRR